MINKYEIQVHKKLIKLCNRSFKVTLLQYFYRYCRYCKRMQYKRNYSHLYILFNWNIEKNAIYLYIFVKCPL